MVDYANNTHTTECRQVRELHASIPTLYSLRGQYGGSEEMQANALQKAVKRLGIEGAVRELFVVLFPSSFIQ